MTLSLADECERLNEPNRLLDEEKKNHFPSSELPLQTWKNYI